MYLLNDKIRELQPYEPLEGNYPIRLDANESFLSVPSNVALKMVEAFTGSTFHRYPDPMAKDVCAAFAAYYGISPQNVTAGNGSDELISVLLTGFLMKGDTVLTLTPDFSMYRFYSSMTEVKCLELTKRPDLTIDVDELISVANQNNAKAIVFSNPCNPTSLGIPREEVRRLLRSVEALVILDEAYMDFWNQSLLDEVNDFSNLVVLRTCSKALGLAALRLGFAVANETLTKAIRSIKSPYNVNTVTQNVAAVVLSEPSVLDAATKTLVNSRQELQSELLRVAQPYANAVQVYESCTNFVLLKLSNAQQVYAALLQRGIAVRCMGSYLRITAGSPAENTALIAAIEDILRQVVPS